MRAIGLVPARGGSRGIPRKNLAGVAGKPLIAWTIEAAQAAGSLAGVVVSTDDDEIAAMAERLHAEVLRRPGELAADDTPMIEVVLHAANAIAADAFVLLQPTSPLRRPEHIDEAVQLFESSGADAVVSVVDVPHQYRADKVLTLDGDRVIASGDGPLHRNTPARHARNGPAVLVLRAAGLAERGLYGGDVRACVMNREDSLDVDEAFELVIADAFLRRRT